MGSEREVNQRPHRTVRAQQRVAQLEQRVAPRGRICVQLRPEVWSRSCCSRRRADSAGAAGARDAGTGRYFESAWSFVVCRTVRHGSTPDRSHRPR
ncbi:hypothetical protein C4J65_35370 [Streptomyces sp. CB09001]|nr:hypothetical protein C4J65_35370 [Streptomyces sp. CB09001]